MSLGQSLFSASTQACKQAWGIGLDKPRPRWPEKLPCRNEGKEGVGVYVYVCCNAKGAHFQHDPAMSPGTGVPWQSEHDQSISVV